MLSLYERQVKPAWSSWEAIVGDRSRVDAAQTQRLGPDPIVPGSMSWKVWQSA